MAWTDPKTWSTNEILSASDVNTYVRDNERAISKFTSYTPVWGGSTTNPAIGNGIMQGRYVSLDEWCYVWIGIAAGSTTTYGSGLYSLTLPFNAMGTWEQYITFNVFNVGVQRYSGYGAVQVGSNLVYGMEFSNPWATGVNNFWAPTMPFTFGNGDQAIMQGHYRRV